MADNIQLQVIAASLPPGSCLHPSIVALIGKTQVLFPANYDLFVVGPNEPTVEQRTYAWIKTLSATGEIVGLFSWSPTYGIWLKRHFPSGVPTNERRIFIGSLTDLETHDGGESATVTATTGPFWQQDTAFTDKLLLGAGATAVGVDTGSTYGGGSGTAARGVYIIKPSGRIYDRSS